jgi:hypothetical protein
MKLMPERIPFSERRTLHMHEAVDYKPVVL